MPRIPNKQRKIFTVTPGGLNGVELVVTDSQYYTGFTFQFVGLTAGLSVKLLASLDNSNFGVLDSSFTTTTAAGTVELLEIHAPFPGGIKLEYTGNLAAGTIIVSMHEPAFSAQNT